MAENNNAMNNGLKFIYFLVIGEKKHMQKKIILSHMLYNHRITIATSGGDLLTTYIPHGTSDNFRTAPLLQCRIGRAVALALKTSL